MNIKYFELLIKENEKEILHLNSILSELEVNRRNIPKKEFDYEFNRINYYLEKEIDKLKNNNLIIESYKIILRELNLIEKLNKYIIKDEYDRKEYEYELERRNEIIEYYKKNLPKDIYKMIEQEITNNKLKDNAYVEQESNNKIEDTIDKSKEINLNNNNNNNVILLPAASEELNIESDNKDVKNDKSNSEQENKQTLDNVILLPPSNEELTLNNNSEIKKHIKYTYTIEEINDNSQDNVNIDNNNMENNNNDIEALSIIDEEQNDNKSENTELKVEEVKEANSILKSRVIEKVKKYGVKALIMISSGAALSIIVNPLIAFSIVGAASLIREINNNKKKLRKKGKYLRK